MAASLCIVMLTGCASVRTLTEYQSGDPVFFSGTRLDVAAINDDQVYLDKLQARPPAWPWVDLPFSLVADLLFWLLPRSTPASR